MPVWNTLTLALAAEGYDTYDDFRDGVYENQGDVIDCFHSRASKWEDGSKLSGNDVVFVSKPILFYKDTWHCGTKEASLRLMQILAGFPDMQTLELKGHWVSADSANAQPHDPEPRGKVTG